MHDALAVEVVCPEGQAVHALVVCWHCQAVVFGDEDGCCGAPVEVADALGVIAWWSRSRAAAGVTDHASRTTRSCATFTTSRLPRSSGGHQ